MDANKLFLYLISGYFNNLPLNNEKYYKLVL